MSREFPLWDKASLLFSVSGTGVIIIAPFTGAGRPLLNNYLPVLQHPVYYLGLTLFTVGIISHLVRSIASMGSLRSGLDSHFVIRTGISLSAVLTAAALISFLASFAGMGGQYQGQVFFEFVFWGAGHVVQFSYTLLMLDAGSILRTAVFAVIT